MKSNEDPVLDFGLTVEGKASVRAVDALPGLEGLYEAVGRWVGGSVGRWVGGSVSR